MPKIINKKPYKVLKDNRIIILLHNPNCELCGAPAKHIHHRDFKRVNHSLSNLQALCVKCHGYVHRRRGEVERCGLGYKAALIRRKKNIPLNFPKNRWWKEEYRYKLLFK